MAHQRRPPASARGSIAPRRAPTRTSSVLPRLAFNLIVVVVARLGGSAAVAAFAVHPSSTAAKARSALGRDRIVPRIRACNNRAYSGSHPCYDAAPTFLLASEGSPEDDVGAQQEDVPECVSSPVLRQVYPALLKHKEEHGHPNIPLGTSEGRMCKTLRRLKTQEKLSDEEVNLLDSLGFRFNSLEQVYEEADFDELLGRLVEYEKEHSTGYQIPKKYVPDPELGAWVTGIRRLGPEGVDPSRRDALDAIGFAWISTRKCGSSFMKNYRAIKERLEQASGEEERDEVLADPDVRRWVVAQRGAYEKGNLSEARVEYMDKLGVSWREA